jgi:hypothetical protein
LSVNNVKALSIVAAGLLLIFSLPAWCQAPTGEITGSVTDSTGAVISGALVTLVNPATNTQRTARTNTDGIYDLPALPPGTYNLKAEMQGFSTQVRNDIDLQVAQVARLDIALRVGNVSEVIEVAGGAPVLETESASLGTVIENQRIQELPLNGRNYLQLAGLTPGATTNSAPSSVGTTRQGGSRSQTTVSVAGQRIFFNHYTLDGIENTDPSFNSYLFLPSLDALQEFKVESGIFPAEYGHNMSQINVTTKSGTNQVHGTAFEFLRNSALDAKNFFDSGAKPIPPFKRNQFGGTIGGPVTIPHLVRGTDKLFFFVDYEGLRERKALTQPATVPSSAWVQGNYSGVSTTIYDPATRVYNFTNGVPSSVVSAQPFPGNIIPTNRISPISLAYMQQWTPAPNVGGPLSTSANNFLNTEGRPTNANQENARFDYVQSAASSWMFRYSHSGEALYTPINIPNEGTNTTSQVHQGMLGHTWVLGANKVNDFKFGISRLENLQATVHAGSRNIVAELGIQGIDTSNPLYWGTPNVNPGGGISNLGENSDVPFNTWDTIIQVTDNFSWIRGKHAFKFGGDVSRTRYNVLNGTVTRGRFTENGQYTGSGLPGAVTGTANNVADFMLGLFAQTEGQVGEPLANMRSIYLGLYFQDSWKVTPKLTINYGLRWEDQTPFKDKHDNFANIDFRWDNSMFPTFVRAGTGDPLQGNPPFALPASIPYVRDGRFGDTVNRNNPRNFGPRLGIAYSLNSKTVIRAGAGVYYVNEVASSSSFEVARNAPFSIRRSETANTVQPNLSWAQIFTTPGIPSFILVTQYNEPTAYVPQWSFGVQRELARNVSLEVNYVGSAGVHLRRFTSYNTAPPGPGNINARRPFPIFNGTFQVTNAPSHSSYDALQVRLQRRFSSGLTLLSSFSYGKSIDNGSAIRQQGNDLQQPSDDYNLRSVRGLSSFDFRRRLTNSILYELPFGKGKPLLGTAGGVWNTIVGGWQAGTMLTFQDGFPFTPTCGSSAVQNGGDTCLPDATGINPNLPRDQQDPRHFFNTAAFVDRLPGGVQYRYGNAGRGTIIGPGIIDWDFSLTKNFRLAERKSIEFRTEFFNIPNHPIFGFPGASPGTSTYGVISSTAVDSRQLQFGLKFLF